MSRNMKQMGRWIVIAVTIGLFCSSEARAKKPPKPGGGEAKYNHVVLAPPGVEISGSGARDLDESGNVVGFYSDSVNDRNGFYYDRGENSYLLYDPGIEVSGLNNFDEMVGGNWNVDEEL